MKKNIFGFSVFFLCNMVLFLFSEQLYAEDFCSDIKIPMIRYGDFDRCEAVKNCNDSSAEQCCEENLKIKINGDWNKGSKVILKFNVTSNTVENENCVEETQKLEFLNNTNDTNATQKTSKIIITRKDDKNSKNCTTITKTPVRYLEENNISVYDPSTGTYKSILKAPKPAIFVNSLNNVKDGSCKLKSCLELTLEELEAIDYSKNFVSDSNGKFVFPPKENCSGNDEDGCKDEDGILFYKFCNPKPDDKDIYCHDFTDASVLQYLWRRGTAYDGTGNYHCILHQCPINNGLTLNCDTNYLNFADRDENYLKNYLKYIVNIKKVGTKEVDQFNKQELLEALRTAKCDSFDYNKEENKGCLMARFSMMETYSSEEDANKYCDDYVGLDKNLYKSNKGPLSSDDQRKIINILQLSSENTPVLKEECDENKENCKYKYECTKTYDCALSESSNKYKTICSNTEGNTRSDPDNQLSYFYRPVPPSPATEICPSEDETNCAGMEGRTVIRRTLRGKVDYQLEENGSGSRWASNYWTYQKDGNRPEKVQDYFGKTELCASSDDDFKNFESEILNVWFLGIHTTYNYGKYYDGFWRVTKAGKLPHILPICESKASRLGVYGSGREYMCGNSGNICNTPSWDSYYIKGVPSYEWKNSDANMQSVTLTACLRQKNTGELNVCGERECRVDCAFGECLYQWCGIDRCVKLTSEVGKACPVIPNSSEILDKDFMNNYQTCAQKVSDGGIGGSSVRFRLQALDRNAYVFLDMTSLGCDVLNTTRRRGDTVDQNGKYQHKQPKFVSYNNPKSDENTIGGTFTDGILDKYELYDDNSLTDNNCDNVINDQDIFGEYLYDHWHCKVLTKQDTDPDDTTVIEEIPFEKWCDETNRPSNQYNSNCITMRISGSDTTGALLEDKYIPLDIVQYRGNNQNIDRMDNPRDFCKTNQLVNCRGYFDKDNNFIREQQAVILPIPVVPDFFYKHATYDNVPDLFLPILSISTGQRASDSVYVSLDLVDDKNPLLLKFFEPSIGIQYGSDDTFENTRYEFCTEGGNCKCLYKKTGCDCSKDYCVKELSGDTSLDKSIVTIPFESTNVIGKVKTTYGKGKDKDAEIFYVFKKTAYLDPEPAARVCLYQILVNDKERLVRCLNRTNPLISNFFIKPDVVNIKKPTVKAYFHNLNKKDLISGTKISLDNSNSIIFYNNNNTSHNEDDDKLIESDYAYGQGYPIFLQKTDCSKLYYDCIFYRNQYREKSNNSETSKEELADLQNKINDCDLRIDLNCKNQNGNENLVLKTNSDGTAELIKVKENPSAIGGYNQMCVTKGFEKDKTYQLIEAMPMQYGVLGKCILTDESKKNPNCRKKFYYEYCSQLGKDNNGNDCVCLNGNNNCDCKDNNSCVKQVNCSKCDTDNNAECINKLPDGCFVSGFNSNNSVLNNNGELIDVCECQKARTNTNNATRQPTPRELGLCVDLIDLHFCEAIKYYDKNRNYIQGGDGKVLDIIKTDHYSNIWRTSQKQLGKTYMGDFGHAEFDKTNDCSGLPSEFCNLIRICYRTSSSSVSSLNGYLKGQLCEDGDTDCACENLQIGTCKGFWKSRDNNTVPLAKCGPYKNGDEIFRDDNGDPYYIFELIPNTGCERYSCPAIIDKEAITKEEKDKSDGATETSVNEVDTRGKSNGFATWGEYQKGTYAISAENLEKGIENDNGDDIEQREAEHCLQGYGPAGSNFAIKEYVPLSAGNISSNSININSSLYTDENINKNEILDNIIKNMLGYDLYVNNKTSSLDTKKYTSNANINANDDQKLKNYNRFTEAMGYYAKDHLPVRYCSQLGNWMGVDDIYNQLYSKYKIEPYYTKNSAFHNDGLTSDGFVKKVINEQGTNTYGNTIQYGKRYCERLVCQAINENDIGLLSVEASEPEKYLQYNDLSEDIRYNIAYPNAKNLNYPKVANNPDDKRTNSIYNNRYTFWRHAGGATWSETPAPRESDKTDVIIGTCYENGGFYPSDTEFLYDKDKISSFDRQYESLFSPNGSNQTANLKLNSLKAESSPSTQPKRVCSKWGIWSDIENECVATCEPLDPFRTNFRDINEYKDPHGDLEEDRGDGLLQNYEITELYRDPKYRTNYYDKEKYVQTKIRYGDKYTGGAKWGRTKAGEVAIGECDARIGKTNIGSAEYLKRKQNGFPDDLNKSGIQFLRTGSLSAKSLEIVGYNGKTKLYENINTQGRPYRACLPDGTWGPVQDPCINFRTCADDIITTKSVLKSDQSGQFQIKDNKEDIQNIATLSGGAINFEDAENSSGFEILLKINCDSNKSFESGTIQRTCNISTGDWVENTAITTCALKTCKGGQYDLTPTNKITIENNKYYPKLSGYEGAITINKNGNEKSYSGYGFSQACPDNYMSGQVYYTCNFDEDNKLDWSKSGICQPKTCSLTNLQNICNDNTGFNSPSSLTLKTESSIALYDNGDSISGSNATVGTEVSLSCKSGYYPDNLYATCNKNQQWQINGNCVKVCDKNAIQLPAGSELTSTTTGTVYENRYFANGAIIYANCKDGYSEQGDYFYKCENGQWNTNGQCLLCPAGFNIVNGSCSGTFYSDKTISVSGFNNIEFELWGQNSSGKGGYVKGRYQTSSNYTLKINFVNGGSGGKGQYTSGSGAKSGEDGENGGKGVGILIDDNILAVAAGGGGDGGDGGCGQVATGNGGCGNSMYGGDGGNSYLSDDSYLSTSCSNLSAGSNGGNGQNKNIVGSAGGGGGGGGGGGCPGGNGGNGNSSCGGGTAYCAHGGDGGEGGGNYISSSVLNSTYTEGGGASSSYVKVILY